VEYDFHGNTGADASGIAVNSPLITDPGLVSGKFIP
jgi:hypothetical protein